MAKWYRHKLSPEEHKQFIQNVLLGNEQGQAYIGDVGDAIGQQIENLTGTRVSKMRQDSGSIRHAYKKPAHHLNSDDLEFMEEVTNNPVKITKSPQQHEQKDVVVVEGDKNGPISYVQSVSPNYGGWLGLITAYRNKNGGQRTLAGDRPAANVRNALPLSNTSIPEVNTGVNTTWEEKMNKLRRLKKALGKNGNPTNKTKKLLSLANRVHGG
jgi:hypothetical protein